MNKPITNGRVTRWLLLLQEFDITILDKLGKENVVVDFLPRLTNEGYAIPIEDTFPDEDLFYLFLNTPWFAYIANCLAAGKLLQHLSLREWQRVIRQSAMYSWVQGHLFRTGLDLVIQRCAREDKVYGILKACHSQSLPWWTLWGTFHWQENYKQRATSRILLAYHLKGCQEICQKSWQLSANR